MHTADQFRRELDAVTAAGDAGRILDLQVARLRIVGLDAALAADLDRRWGAFAAADVPSSGVDRTLHVGCASSPQFLEPRDDSLYRLELFHASGGPVVASRWFVAGPTIDPAVWRVALCAQDAEPRERIVDNVCRVLLASIALECGGFALHGAGLLHRDRAWILAGKSRSGKSTAVGRAAPARSLGDDFAVLVPRGEAWVAPALPFDNAERIDAVPPPGPFPVAGIWRLIQSERNAVERPGPGRDVASLAACLAFPWIFPGQSDALFANVERFIAAGGFAHLLFRRDVEIWEHLCPL